MNDIKPTAPEPCFDRATLLERCNGDEEIAKKLLHLSATTFPVYIENLCQFINQKDFEMAKLWAHTLKGAALNMSFHKIAQLAIECNAIDEPDFEKMRLLADKIRVAFAEIRPEIHQFLDTD